MTTGNISVAQTIDFNSMITMMMYMMMMVMVMKMMGSAVKTIA